MTPNRALKLWIVVCSALAAAGPAAATASIGGSVSLVGGAGACNVSASVPLDTLQDNFLLSRATGCAGTASDAQIRASARWRVGSAIDGADSGLTRQRPQVGSWSLEKGRVP